MTPKNSRNSNLQRLIALMTCRKNNDTMHALINILLRAYPNIITVKYKFGNAHVVIVHVRDNETVLYYRYNIERNFIYGYIVNNQQIRISSDFTDDQRYHIRLLWEAHYHPRLAFFREHYEECQERHRLREKSRRQEEAAKYWPYGETVKPLYDYRPRYRIDPSKKWPYGYRTL